MASNIFRLPRPASAESTHTLPRDLLLQATRRLRVLTLLFAFTFFMANFVPWFLQVGGPDAQTRPLWWLPGTASITAALLVFALTWKRGLDPGRLMVQGLVFGVVGSFGIAAAEYWGIYSDVPLDPDANYQGLSWVANWMLFFIIVIPSRPGRSLIAALASASAPPIVLLLSTRFAGTQANISANQFFAGMILPYLLCALLAYVGARVVYQLGREVRKARELGSYQLTERLGAGGMGEVWRAEHKMLARPAAIKLIRPEFLGQGSPDSDQVLRARFEREAQVTASMRSPHTIEVYDFGIADDGTFYYVMELLDGIDLHAFGRRFGPMSPERTIHVLRQACHSLAEAHEARLIHRDIKPANIFLCRYGREVDYVKVLDFGLAKTGPFTGSDDPMLTSRNIVTGTPAFMAPEQILGNRPVDGRSDLYSLGCVGFWMLTGDLVFQGDTVMQTMAMHAEKPAPRPSERSELRIPEELDRIILMCLEKDPDRRPGSADELSRLLEDCPVGKPWNGTLAHAWWEMHHPTESGVRSAEDP